ncbi:tripartite tricarboxylate transporter TctB family protein [Planomonospora venezuelensis]|uniref:Putative tricarboxylic transport membrane protein n=1 Tax=Planomonospora venezuelensis TaxID=1999 RepID=A0A841D3S3_PLAVE|nr:tripartite tricarboxylate transporter TctB family protein [Planomonospora venezuelensis]MBB5963038.1 putative tricarboxylic transport membrane protein [Planomonospora venezuelensis]GIN00606.1 membrane protein [Planomonospora venezuelensis]
MSAHEEPQAGRDPGAPEGASDGPAAAHAPSGGPGAPAPDAGGPAGRGWRRPELALALVVLGLGVFVIAGTADVAAAGSGIGLGPRFFPVIVGSALLLIGAFYVADVLRGGHGDPEESEDVDAGAGADWKTVALVSVIFLAFAGLVDLLGWIIAGALLFFGLSVTLGAAHRLRAGAVAIVLSTLSYLAFVKGLGVTLPTGLLSGVI